MRITNANFSKALSGALLLSLLLNCGGETPVDVTATESSATTFSSGVIQSSTGESTNPLDTTLSSSNTDISNPSSSAVAVVPTSSSSQSTVPVSSSVGGSDPVSSSSVVVPPVSSSSSTPGDAVYLNLQGDSGVYVDPRDNNDYKWVKVGTQIWMAQNLRYDGNGTLGEVDGLRIGTGSYAPDRDHTGDGDFTGIFYTWSAAMGLDTTFDKAVYSGPMEGVQGICPEGWRLPSDNDWENLASYIANDLGKTAKEDDDWLEIGPYLKTRRGWNVDGGGLDTYGFSAAPAGRYRQGSLAFENVMWEASFWSTEQDPPMFEGYPAASAWHRTIDLNGLNTKFQKDRSYKTYGFSVRCVAN